MPDPDFESLLKTANAAIDQIGTGAVKASILRRQGASAYAERREQGADAERGDSVDTRDTGERTAATG